jgi:hypothetical protein
MAVKISSPASLMPFFASSGAMAGPRMGDATNGIAGGVS